jgi:hypothetical protein
MSFQHRSAKVIVTRGAKGIVTRGPAQIQSIADSLDVERHGNGMGSLKVHTLIDAADTLKLLEGIARRQDVVSVDAGPVFAAERAIVSSLTVEGSRDRAWFASCVEFRALRVRRGISPARSGAVEPFAAAGVRLEVERARAFDPLDVEYDGISLRNLLAWDEGHRREAMRHHRLLTRTVLTTTQRAAVSEHWSAQLRARLEKAQTAEREQVVLDCAEEL